MDTARHLRRIRIRLTVIFSVMMAVALGVVTVLVIDADRRVRDSEMSSELLTTAQRGAQALYFNEEGDLDARDFEAADTLLWSYPQLWVFHVDDDAEFGVSPIAGPAENYYPDADTEWLQEYAAAVIFEREVSPWDLDVDADLTLRARGVALTDNEGDPFRAAVIAIADTNDYLAGNDGFTTRVILIVTSFFVLSTGGGYLLAGRSMRPTAVALEQQERLIADAAHELRTPVARIRAAAEGGLAEDEPSDATLTRVVSLSGDAGQAIDDLLTLARMDAGRQEVSRESLRLDLLAEAVADRYDDVSVEAVPTVVEGDASLLGRAIDNLVRNAVQHGRREDSATPITVTVYPNLVRVADEGPGIADEELPHLFERFRSRPGSSGHGLGLPIAAWVARAHRGKVEATQREGGGAAFSLSLPS